MKNIVDVNAFTSPVQVLQDGDPVVGSETETSVQALANRTAYLQTALNVDAHETISVTGDSSATRASIVATGNNGKDAITALGNIAGAGINATGGTTGPGVNATGGSSSGDGVTAVGGAGNGIGGRFTGIGAGRAVKGIGIIEASLGMMFKAAGNGSNVMDGYHSGSFTPTLLPSGSNAVSYTVQSGTFIRIGNLVFLTAHLTGSLGASTGTLGLSGLPYNVVNTPGGLNGIVECANAFLHVPTFGGQGQIYGTNGTKNANMFVPNLTTGSSDNTINASFAFLASNNFTVNYMMVYTTTDAF